MSRIKSKNTAPELAVRGILRRLGIRYRLHAGELPGSPDIVNRTRRFAIFVHGCFWHGHSCKRGKLPATNKRFWANKIGRNRKRDAAAVSELRRQGWVVVTVWDCELRYGDRVMRRLQRAIGSL